MKIIRRVFVPVLVLSLAAGAYALETTLIGAPDIVPPATDEMQHPEFWISRLDGDPETVIMTSEQINAFNQKNRTRKLEWNDINGKPASIEDERNHEIYNGLMYYLEDPLTLTAVPVERLRDDFKRLHKYLTGMTLWDRRQIPYPDEKKMAIIDAINASALPAAAKPRYGLIVRHTLQQAVPIHEQIYWSQYGWLDMSKKCVLETAMPVAVLWETKNHDWYYVKSEYSYGWVPAENVALGNKRDIVRFADPEKFVVCTSHKVPVFAGQQHTAHITDIYMGARLPLLKKSNNGYNVLVPYRAPDGTLKMVKGSIRVDADICVGFQPYTRRAVIETMFKLLNRPYGWHGTDHERDCVGAIRAVYKTFGIFLCRWTTFMLYSTDHVFIFPKDTPKDVKYRYLEQCEPGITVCGFSGHVLLYIGEVDGVHYTIHQNGYSYHDKDGTELRIGRVSVNYTEIEGGGDINRWTELSVFKP